MRSTPAGKTFIALWAIATATGLGLGWSLASATNNPFLIGVVLGTVQALLLLPMRGFALLWPFVTGLGWIVGVWLLVALNGPSHDWHTFLGSVPFIAVPVMTLVQWLVVSQLFKREAFILWFGASVCSFPVAGFLAIVVSLLAAPESKSFLAALPPAIAPVFWLVGAFYGLSTGIALSVGAPDLYQRLRQRDGLAIGALALSVAGVAVIALHDSLNALTGYDLIHGEVDPGLVLLRIVVYVSLGFSLDRILGIRAALILGVVLAAADILLEVASKLAMSAFGYFSGFGHGTWPDYPRDIALPVAVWTFFAAVGVMLSHLIFLHSVPRAPRRQVYRVKL